AAFGQVIEGIDAAEEISRGPAKPVSEEIHFVNMATDPVIIEAVTVETFGTDYPEPDKLPVPTSSEEEMMAEFKRVSDRYKKQ
ncbi:MAG: hypothetical protein JRJ37_09550, partial [Deltaproteobacteria bacterium]|nr:hypothetical protein [Deltaproteobacteria bacterium]